jgi:hypothetical protein
VYADRTSTDAAGAYFVQEPARRGALPAEPGLRAAVRPARITCEERVRMNTRGIWTAAGAAAAVCLSGGVARAELVYGVTANQSLISFDTTAPTNILSGVAISGLLTNETILGIDFRPADGQLYALGSFSNLYTIDLASGAAARVGGSSFSPGLNGSAFGFDFNPTIDRIRVVSEANQNLVLNPNTGGATSVTPLFFGAGDANAGVDPNVVGSAYTNNFAGATTSQLYGIDTNLDILVTQANSAGTLGTVGALGLDLTNLAGFDISGATGIAYLAGQDSAGGITKMWTVDLSTGMTTLLGQIDGGVIVSSIAVVPAPGSLGVVALGGLAMARRRRA